MNANTVRLFFAVVLAWLTGALGGLAAVPYWAFVFVFTGVMVVALGVAVWDRGEGPNRYPWRHLPVDAAVGIGLGIASRFVPIRRRAPDPRYAHLQRGDRYRGSWLVAVMVLAISAGWLNMFSFAAAVVQLDGERVHAHAIRAEGTRLLFLGGDGWDVECVLARPDGRRIPGSLPDLDGKGCPETADVYVDPHGIVDAVPASETPDGTVQMHAIVLGVALALCVPAALPRRQEPVASRRRTRAATHSEDRPRRRRSRLRRKRRLRR